VNTLELLDHALSFAAPAFAVALVLAVAGRFLLPAGAPRPAIWVLFAIDLVAGLAALAAGLWYFGHDGKMATYALLVVAAATAQWLGGRAWRR
jgi:hypothetical protein